MQSLHIHGTHEHDGILMMLVLIRPCALGYLKTHLHNTHTHTQTERTARINRVTIVYSCVHVFAL